MMKEAGSRPSRGAWALFAIHLVYASTLLATLGYNFDEGVYILQSQEILAGNHPNVDFFSHQTPPYLYVLAPVGLLAPHSVFGYRFVSLLATALAGLVVYLAGRRYFSEKGALFAQALFASAALQFYGMIALPMGLMVLTSTVGLYLVAFHDSRKGLIAGSLLLVLSVLFKPLAVSTGLALGLFLLLPGQWKKIPVGALSVAGGAILSWAILDLPTGGTFTGVLKLQAFRFSGKSGFEVMRSMVPFQDYLNAIGVDTALEWNLVEHFRAFVFDFKSGTFLSLFFLLLAILGQLLLFTPAIRVPPGMRILLTLWWLVPFAFSIFVWEPVWDHYFVQYLPPLAILAAIPLHWLASRRRLRRIMQSVAVSLLLFAVGQGVFYWNTRRVDYNKLTQPQSQSETWLTFDPFINFITGTRPACGLIDPFNVYEARSLAGAATDSAFEKFVVTREALMSCLESDPDIKIGVGTWAGFFLDPQLRAYFDAQPKARFVKVP